MSVHHLTDLRTALAPGAAHGLDRGCACAEQLGVGRDTREGVIDESSTVRDRDATRGQLVCLADGATVRLRPARCDDDDALQHMFVGLSDRSRYLYYCAGVPASESWAKRFAALGRVDWHTSYALVAEAVQIHDSRDQVIGLARLVRSAEGPSAEIGILLADAWQSRGLGRFVLERLCVEAHRLAATMLTGNVLWENQRMMRLARRVFPRLELTCSQGVCELRMALDV